MVITAQRKQEVLQTYRTHERDTGSPQVQVSLLTGRIRDITEHLKRSRKDHAGQRGLLLLVGRRNRLLRYLERTDRPAYLQLIAALGLRK